LYGAFGLTRREREVLDLICAEHTNGEIAAKLFIPAKTVSHHVSAILAKLSVPTCAAARLRQRLTAAMPSTHGCWPRGSTPPSGLPWLRPG